ncbi:MAG: BamA/TamA family outer membrane protein [Planctomycetota bacterium]
MEHEKLEGFSLLGGPLHRLGCRLGLVLGGTNTIALGLALGVSGVLAFIEGISHQIFSLSLIGGHVRLLVAIHFPRSGWRGAVNVFNSNSGLGAGDKYTKWDADGSVAYSFGEHTLHFSAKVGGKMGSDPLPRYDLFQWGGFLHQSGYRTGQLVGENLKYGQVLYYHRLLRGTLFEGAYGGISLEVGKVGKPLVPGNPDGLLESTSIFVATDTLIGPAYLAYGRTVGGTSSFYFYLGTRAPACLR